MASGRQTYGYLPSRWTSLPCKWYQIILFGGRINNSVTKTRMWANAERDGRPAEHR